MCPAVQTTSQSCSASSLSAARCDPRNQQQPVKCSGINFPTLCAENHMSQRAPGNAGTRGPPWSCCCFALTIYLCIIQAWEPIPQPFPIASVPEGAATTRGGASWPTGWSVETKGGKWPWWATASWYPMRSAGWLKGPTKATHRDMSSSSANSRRSGWFATISEAQRDVYLGVWGAARNRAPPSHSADGGGGAPCSSRLRASADPPNKRCLKVNLSYLKSRHRIQPSPDVTLSATSCFLPVFCSSP